MRCDYRSVKAVALVDDIISTNEKGIFLRTESRFAIVKGVLLIYVVLFTKSKGSCPKDDVIRLVFVGSCM